MKVTRRSARVLLIRDGDLVLMRRTHPGQDPYLVAIGGGVEEQDASVEAALRRAVAEELGGTIDEMGRVLVVTDDLADGNYGVQYVYVARLESLDLTARTGSEFAKPERGKYEVFRVPFTPAGIEELALPLTPPTLEAFVRANVVGIHDALDASDDVDLYAWAVTPRWM